MTRDQLRAIGGKQFTLDDIDLGGALTPPYRAKADAQIASALSIEWWRGYYTGIDLAENLQSAVERVNDDEIEAREREAEQRGYELGRNETLAERLFGR